jgi:O-antigen ligase
MSAVSHSWMWRPAVVVLLPLVAIAGVGSASGGYFATSFGWATLAFAWAAIISLTIAAPVWGWFDRIWLAAAACLCVYTFLSAAWAGSVGDAVDAGLRTLVYLTGIAGTLLVLRRGDLSCWLAGLVLGVAGVCVYSLATRLFPTHFGGLNASSYRLFVPVGYWNALGIFAGIALLLGLGVVALGRWRVLRVLSAVALVLLAPTVYFTFSRGAWLALMIGAAAIVALGPNRLRLVTAGLVLGAMPAVGVLLAWRSPALTQQTTTLAAASDAGRKLALELVLLALGQAAVAVGYVALSARIRVSRAWSRGAGIALTLAMAGALAAVFAVYGGPLTLARRAYDSFVSSPTGGTNLNSRLFSLSNDNRTVLWHAAWKQFEAHPLVGSGAGSFGRWWLAHRTSAYFVQNAHNLYVQTLGEFGLVGIVLLVALLGVPLVAAVRARRHPLVAPALGGYVAYLVHASVDWDWQMPAVTLLALFAGGAIVIAARRSDSEGQPLGLPARLALGAGAAFVVAVAFVGLIGNIALSRADDAVLHGLGQTAAAQGAKAHRWAPWSAQALEDLGDGRLLLGQKRSGLAALRAAVAKDPGDWQIWFDIAAATDGSAHRTALSRAKALNPYSPEIADVEQAAAATRG